MPALEAITGAGLEAAMITTDLTSAGDRSAGEVLGLAGLIGVPFFRPGNWKFSGPPAQLQRRIMGLAAYGRTSNIAMGIPNTAESGGAVQEIEAAIRPIDPLWVGYDFDPAAASAASPENLVPAFSVAKPRLKMVTARDCRSNLAPCPLGEGAVDWPRFFDLLARARFTGPISLRIEYQPGDELVAIRRDLAFLRKGLASAHGKE
jgi:sugar phosphate isomerase/epimerase